MELNKEAQEQEINSKNNEAFSNKSIIFPSKLIKLIILLAILVIGFILGIQYKKMSYVPKSSNKSDIIVEQKITSTPTSIKAKITITSAFIPTAIPTKFIVSNTPTPFATQQQVTPTNKTTRTPNPPLGGISWPQEGESLSCSGGNLCFVDAPAGGDQSGVQRSFNANDTGWNSFVSVYPSSSTCFAPKEGKNSISVKYRNQYGEESPVYTRSFMCQE